MRVGTGKKRGWGWGAIRAGMALAALCAPGWVQAHEAPAAADGSAEQVHEYVQALRAAIQRHWVRPDALPAGKCRVRIRQVPSGEVVEVEVQPDCPYDSAGQQSLRRAVLKASPLPYAGFEAVFQRDVVLVFVADALAKAVDVPKAAQVAETVVLPLSARVEGRGYAELSAAWWQWASNLPVEPYLDPDGRFCDLGQDGPVWFLAGTNGRFDARRECAVPEGKHVFLPIINMMVRQSVSSPKRGGRAPCGELKADAAVNNDHLVSAVVLIDGVPVEDVVRYRVRSDGCFALFPDDPEHGDLLAASDGYWLLIKPLPPGRHAIVVGANYGAPSGGFHRMLQNFEYELRVGMADGFVMN